MWKESAIEDLVPSCCIKISQDVILNLIERQKEQDQYQQSSIFNFLVGTNKKTRDWKHEIKLQLNRNGPQASVKCPEPIGTEKIGIVKLNN